MSRLLRTLVKVGLVELDPEEQERISEASDPKADPPRKGGDDIDQLLKDTEALLGSTSTAAPAPAKAAPPPPPPSREVGPAPRPAAPPPPKPAVRAPPLTASGVLEGRPFSELYTEASVQIVAFPAEKLQRLLEGLKAMDAVTRKAAVLAMDAADDAWSIDDPLADARRKITVLQAHKGQLSTVVQDAEARATRELKSADDYQTEATTKIRAQIAELEALLQQELTGVATRKAEIQSRASATRESAARESARVDQEIASLNGILQVFSG